MTHVRAQTTDDGRQMSLFDEDRPPRAKPVSVKARLEQVELLCVLLAKCVMVTGTDGDLAELHGEVLNAVSGVISGSKQLRSRSDL